MKVLFAIGAIATMAGCLSFAQAPTSASPATTPAKPDSIGSHRENQQNRAANGGKFTVAGYQQNNINHSIYNNKDNAPPGVHKLTAVAGGRCFTIAKA